MADLLKALAYLPLAITQAAAYMNTNKTTAAEYLQIFNRTNEDMIALMSSKFDADEFESDVYQVEQLVEQLQTISKSGVYQADKE